MDDRAAFDAYFEDHPDDIVGLLAYADFLDERGDAKEAEFTREMARRGVWPRRRAGGLWDWWWEKCHQAEEHWVAERSYEKLSRELERDGGGGHGCYYTRADAVADLFRVWCELGDATWAEPVTVGVS